MAAIIPKKPGNSLFVSLHLRCYLWSQNWWIRNFSEEELDSSPDGCFYRLNPRSYSWVREEKKRKVKVRQKIVDRIGKEIFIG